MLQQPQSIGLQAPDPPRSRFSKALPAVPGLRMVTEKPTPPPSKTLPAMPPPRGDSLKVKEGVSRTPVDKKSAFLPPLPFEAASSTTPPTDKNASAAKPPTSPPSRMAIPRKPIRKPVAQPSTQPAPSSIPKKPEPSPPPPPPSPPKKASTPASLSPPLPSPPLASPSETLSEILSAYSRSTNGDYGMDEDDLDREDEDHATRSSLGTTTTASTVTPPASTRSSQTSHATIKHDAALQVPIVAGRASQVNTGSATNDGPQPTSAKQTAPAVTQRLFLSGVDTNQNAKAPASGLRQRAASPTKRNDGNMSAAAAHKSNVHRNLPPPPAPAHDEKQLPASRLPSPTSKRASPDSLSSSSRGSINDDSTRTTPITTNPKQQIWERRFVKGSRELPNLKLEPIHNLAEASAVTQTQIPGKVSHSPPVSTDPVKYTTNSASAGLDSQPRIAPLSTTHGLPPVPAKPDVPPKENRSTSPDKLDQNMGNEASKFRKLKDRFHPSSHSRQDSGSIKSEKTVRPSTHRPPTPEYQKEDVKTPIVETYQSPASPASTPELEAERSRHNSQGGLSGETAKEEEESQTTALSNTRNPRNDALYPNGDLYPVRSLPDLKPSLSSDQPLPPPLPTFPHGRRSSAASEQGAPIGLRESVSAGSNRFPSRNAAGPPSGLQSRDQSPRHSQNPENDPRLVHSETQGWLYRGKFGTLYPEMQVSTEPDPRALNFPIRPSPHTISEGAVVTAPPIKTAHHRCFHKHKNMRRIPNKRHPVGCQTCDREDSDDRWVCMFCNLRLCGNCLRKFDSTSRDLQRLMEMVKENGPLTLSSPSRPASAFGLES